MPSLVLPLCLLSLLIDSVYGVKIPFEVSPRSFALDKRADPITLSNTGNAQYIANISIADTTLRVLLDTGSSDLWVNFNGQTPSTTDTGKKVSLAYAIGNVAGNVHTAKTVLGTHTISDQAFIQVDDTSSFASDIHTQGYDGLLGLGPNDASNIRDEIDNDSGDSVLHRIFKQGTSKENYITMLLDRKGDPTDPFTGQFTISEVAEQFPNITSMPKLDVDQVHKLLEAEQHWQVFTDKDVGLIGPDGQVIAAESIVPKAPDGQMVAVFDSGFTLSQVPRDVADAIYGRVNGAEYDQSQELWLVPCGQYLNITFSFGGYKFPIHPLDTVDDNFNMKDSKGNHVCIGAFQPITTAFSIFGNFDMILGMSFMRNSYTLMDYGNWLDDSKSNQQSPYIQLLPLTDSEQGKKDFISVRLSGQDTTGDSQWQLLSTDKMQHSPVSSEEKKKKYQEKVLSRWPYILLGSLIGLALIVGLCIWRCCCRKGRKKNAGMFGKKGNKENSTYLPLQAPVAGQSAGHLPSHGHHHDGGYHHSGHHSGY